jgi:hypothetical protein
MTGVIFTFPPDYLAAAYAVRALRRAGVRRVVLAVDARHPVPAIEGGEVVLTDFDRRGNLNGKPCVEGMLRVMDEQAAADDRWVLKVDSDTLCLGTGWLDGRGEDAVGLWHPGKRGFFGLCYGLRRSSLPRLRARAADLVDDEEMPEDETIYGLAETVWRYRNLEDGCPMAAYSAAKGWERETWLEKFAVLLFQQTEGRERRDVSDLMREFLR